MGAFIDNTSTGTVSVPTTATLGPKVLRTRVVYISAGGENNPCDTFFGEVEDYTIFLLEATCTKIGQACNDGNDCTFNDKFDGNCNCVGTLIDKDDDGVCDKFDVCDGKDDKLDLNRNGVPDCSEIYCIAEGASGTGGDYISRVKFGKFLHSSIQSAYSNFTNKNIEVTQGGVYDISIELATVFPLDTAYFYIDYNQDTLFSPNELIKLSPFDNGTSKGKVTIPLNAKIGKTRLRARVVYANSAYSACGSIFGEVEDYSITIKTSVCPDKGKPCNDGKFCTINDVIDQDCNCTGTFLDDDGDGVCNQDDVCIGDDDNADINLNGILDCKEACLAFGAFNTGGDYIKSVKIKEYTKTSGKSSYSYFTVPVDVLPDEIVEVSVKIDTKFDLDQAIGWVDFNEDKIFGDEELIEFLPYDATNTSLGFFRVPEGTKFGKKLMRIRSYFGEGTAEACGIYSGEVEDYIINYTQTTSTTESLNDTWAVYPNPNNGILNFKSLNTDAISAKIYNQMGQVVAQMDLSEGKTQWDISHINNGLYIVEIQGRKAQVVRRKIILTK